MIRRSQVLSAGVCAVTLLLMAGHSLAQETANVGLALAARARRTPATPLQMALRLEKEQAMGAGILMPVPDRQVRLSGGVIPLDGKAEGFPAEFFKGLVPDEINGVEAWRATLRTDDASGDMLFYNADGEVFWSVAADAKVWSSDWIARLHSTDCKAADFFSTEQVLKTLSERQTRVKLSEETLYRSAWLSTRQYFLPSHVEMTFTFILKEDIDAYRAAGTAARSPAATVLSMPMSMSAPLTNLAVTGFAADTNTVSLSAVWPTDMPISGDALDIFFTRTLIPPAWSNLWRVAVDHAAGAVDVVIPRAELPPAPEVPPAACVTNIVPSAYDPGVMVTNIVCTNGVWLTDSGFFRLADLADTDGDGLTDACENWMYGTRSDLIDTDGDTLDDGWEIKYGLNPFTLDDPSADPDHDGLTHAEECAAGTDPFNGDTDGDGLKDGAEVFAAVARNAGVSAFNVAGGTDLTALLSSGEGLDEGVAGAPLPFPVVFDGTVLSNLSANANGLVGFYSSQGGLGSGRSGNESLEGYTVDASCGLLVAGLWDDLQLYPADLGSTVTLADVTTNGSRFCVIEYRNVGFYNVDPSTNDMVSFQIVFAQGVSNKVSVFFQAAQGRGEGASATLGAQTDRRTLQYACFEERSAYAGLALSYLFGLGTDPLVKDSDDDGLEDGDEVNDWGTDPLAKDTDKDGLEDGGEAALGTSPTNPDTDGDGMTDGWEAGNLLDPIDPADAYGDLDTDGLPNIAEFRTGTDPQIGDWDGDGVPDGSEAAWWATAAPLPWFGVSGGTSVLFNVNSDSGLIPAKLPFPARIGGAVCTNALLDINGVTYFIDRLKPVESGIYSRDSNSILTNSQPLTDNHFAVAAHWDDLYARSAAPATRITVADVTTNGARYCVIEYRDMGFWTNSSARVSFQIVIPENGTNTVCVRYADVAGANSGGAATLGAQGPGATINIPVSCDRPFITNGLTLAYHFGSGGSPFVKDTDGDGLEDGAEAALGTSPANPDSDGDGLPDKWEAGNTLNPLSASGNDGADGDPDGDGLLNRDEFEHNAYPYIADWDEDGLTDLEEVGGVSPADIPWFDLSAGDDITPFFSNLDYACMTLPLAAPAFIRGAVFTNLTLDINGLVYLNPAGYQNSAYSSDGHEDMADWTVNDETLTLAPFWADLIAVTNTAPASKILSGTATDGTNLYRVIEYRNMRIDTWPVSTNNMVSFQVAIPTGATDRVFVRYAVASGTTDGRDASVGLQGLAGTQKDAWCFDQPGRVRPGLSLALVIGTGSDPLIKDTDSDGLSDADEAALGTDPWKRDTDGDRLPDKWEADHGFSPGVNNDTDGIEDNGAEDDYDDDGLSNFDEYLNGTDPREPDSDWDGTDDGDEVGQGSDPNDPSDNGQPPPPEEILQLPFSIHGDWAAWEMTVEGLGPADTRVFKLSTDAPGGSSAVSNKLHKGNSYRITMNWQGSGEHTDPYWYCWEAQVGGLPAAQAYGNPDSLHTAVRVPGVAEIVAGDGWFAQNADGLLTSHVHSSGNGSGNVAGGLEAILYVPKVTFNLMWETGNKANQIFNPTPKDDPPAVPRNVLYVVESPADSKYHVTLDVDDGPLEIHEKLMYAVYDGATKLTDGEGFFPASGPAEITVNHPSSGASIKDFSIKVGYDVNGDQSLGEDEVYEPFEVINTVLGTDTSTPVVRGTSTEQYSSSASLINAGLSDVATPHAVALLKIFIDGNAGRLALTPLEPTAISPYMVFNATFGGYFSEWLTHNAGAQFDDSGNTHITEYIWEEGKSLANLIACSPQLEQAVRSYYEQVIYPQATSYFADHPLETVALFPPSSEGVDVPHESESQPWVPGCTLTFDTFLPDQFGLDDLNASIGRGRLLSHKVQYTVEKQIVANSTILVPTATRSWGEVIDLYDFNHDAGTISQAAAILQIGHGKGAYGSSRDSGNIFRTRIIFRKEYIGLP